MLQPLWESRDRYEELKQMDDAVREVSRLCEELGSTGPPTLPGHTTQGASSRAHPSHRDARRNAEVFCPQGAHRWEAQSLEGVCPLWSWSPMGVQGHHSLCHPHPLRAGFWPCAGPSPPPRADFVQKQGHGRDSLEKPPPHPATGLWWHLEEDRKTHSGSGWLLGLVLCFREARAGLEAFREALRAGLPWQDPRGCRPASGPPATWDPGTCPVMSSHPSVASPPSTPPPPLSWVPSAVGATSLLLRACPHWALPGTPRPHPRAPSRAVCSSHSLQQGPHPAFQPGTPTMPC